MKTVIWTNYGAPDVLKIGEARKPICKDDEILVKVMATTASVGDCEIRGLNLPLAFRLPLRIFYGFSAPKEGNTLGQEFSGVVEQTGKDTRRFAVGDEIFGQTGPMLGAYSQFMALKESGAIAKKPSNISFVQAACMPLGGLESRFYIGRSNLRKGSKVLVIGAGGSIGTMGIQLLKRIGAQVTAVDTGEKFDVMRSAGADHVIDYTKTDYINGTAAYDGILDVVGKTPLKKGIALLNNGGVYMHANPKISHMFFRRFLSGGGGKKIVIKFAEESQADLDYLAGLLEEGKIMPIIDKTFPLEQIVAAHEYVDSGRKEGNVAITVG